MYKSSFKFVYIGHFYRMMLGVTFSGHSVVTFFRHFLRYGQFSVEKRTFFYPFNRRFGSVLLKLYPSNFVRREPRQLANHSCNFFSLRSNA